jgi:hypothetical protein
MRTINEVIDEVIDDHIIARTRHHAFAAALAELFARYPAPENDRPRREYRPVALSHARNGMFAGRNALPVGVLCIPTDELFTVHALIYG